MAHSDVTMQAPSVHDDILVRRIGVSDLREALRRGIDDFRAMPTHVAFIGLIYPVVGLFLSRLIFGYDILPLLFPLAAGFALVGPFAALGLYELSRRREEGLDTGWKHALDPFRSRSRGAIFALGLMLLAIFFVWLAVANALYLASFGYTPAASIPDFLDQVFRTPEGRWLIIAGNGIGFLFAVLVLSISVVSFPLLLDRAVGVHAAVLTSIRAVLANPGPMALWGIIVAAGLVIGSIPFFFGLALIVPILGHATWHLYRRVVAP